MQRILSLLTIIFLILAVAAVVLYFTAGASSKAFFIVGATAVGIRLIHYFIKFISR